MSVGHRVAGLTRTATNADKLRLGGVEPVLGSLHDVEVLRAAAKAADATIHLAFGDDFSRFAELAAQDREAIEVLGAALENTGKRLLVTSGVALLTPGAVATEFDQPGPASPRHSDDAARELAGRGIRVSTIRLAPSVHGIGETHGFIPILIDLARRHGVSAYMGDGQNRWPAVHVADAARLYRDALESSETERVYHAVGEEGIPFRDIAAAIGRKLDIPVEAREPEHFGWFSALAGADVPASSERTRAMLHWQPVGPKLLADILDPAYYGGSSNPATASRLEREMTPATM